MADTWKPFERRYTDAQAAAIVYAMLDHKPRLSGRKAAIAAAAGRLPGAGARLAPFGQETREDGTIKPIPEQTCYDWARRERDAREVKANGRLAKSNSAEHAMRKVLAAAWNDLEAAQKRRARAKLSPLEETRAIRGEVQLARDIAKAEAELRGGAPPSKGDTEAPSTEGNAEADALAREARARARTEQRDTHTQQGSASVTELDQASGSTESRTDSVGRAQSATHLNHVASHL